MPRTAAFLGLIFGVLVLAAGASVNATETPATVVAAVHEGSRSAALALVAQKVDVNVPESDGTTALHWAVHNGDAPLVEQLLKAGAKVNVRNDYGATPLSEAAVLADPALLARLVQAGADVNATNDDGQTALMLVARNGNVEAAKLLIAHHANVNAREKWRQQTALMWAAAQAQPAMVRYLISRGAEVNARSLVNEWERQVTAEPRSQARPAGGLTPLLYAARRGCLDCARALVEGGADVNLADPFGVTPLLMATQNFSFDTAAYLLSKGASPNRWDNAGRSALYAAVDLNTIPFGGRADRPSLDDTTSLELIRRLLAAGANPNLQLKLMPPYRSLRDDRGADGLLAIGATPLLRAAKAGDVPAMKLLLAAGAKVDLPNVSGITPLMAAAGNGSSKIDTRGRYKTPEQAIESIQLLLAAGADINARDAQGQTAVFGAAIFGWNEVIRTLVAHGAKVDVLDSRGRSAVDAALGTGGGGRAGSDPQPETAALLRSLIAQSGAPPVRPGP
jgi:uncharacterized protein